MFGYGVSYCINLIPGEIVVRAPTNVQVEDEVDKRPGFFGHAVLTISWNEAEGLCLMSPCKTHVFYSVSQAIMRGCTIIQ